MKYIATTSFSQGNQNVLNTPDGGTHIERGRVIDLPFDLPITKLPRDEYQKYSVFFSQQPMLVLLDSPKGQEIVREIKSASQLQADKIREAAAAEAAKSRAGKQWYEKPKGVIAIGIFVGFVAGVAAFIFCAWLTHRFPQFFHS